MSLAHGLQVKMNTYATVICMVELLPAKECLVKTEETKALCEETVKFDLLERCIFW